MIISCYEVEMDSNLHFDRRIAGSTTFWIIQFKNQLEDQITYEGSEKIRSIPLFDFIIPMPGGENQWMIADVKYNNEAIESLNKIQQICREIKFECETEMEKIEDYVEKSKKVTDDLDTLDKMIKHFNEIMKKFKNPPKEKKDVD